MGKGQVDHGELRRVMAEVASSLVAGDGDVAEVMHQLTDRCVAVLGLAGAGVRLRGVDGALEVASASDGRASRMEEAQTGLEDGPCFHAFRSACTIAVEDLTGDERWPGHHELARAVGYGGMASVPMPTNAAPIGTVNLYDTEPRVWQDEELEVAALLANMTAGHVMMARSLADSRTLNEQLQYALDSRVVVEQAKGVLAARHGLDVNEAFERLRAHARTHRQRVQEVARAVVAGTTEPDVETPA